MSVTNLSNEYARLKSDSSQILSSSTIKNLQREIHRMIDTAESGERKIESQKKGNFTYQFIFIAAMKDLAYFITYLLYYLYHKITI
jgi:hypothetical protein